LAGLRGSSDDPGLRRAEHLGLCPARRNKLHAAGKTRVIRETRSLDDVNESIADVEAGRVAARIVFEL
jgi:hypothetical protein